MIIAIAWRFLPGRCSRQARPLAWSSCHHPDMTTRYTLRKQWRLFVGNMTALHRWSIAAIVATGLCILILNLAVGALKPAADIAWLDLSLIHI